MREIVVGVDASVASERAMDRALGEAQSSGRPVRAVHAWSTPLWTGVGPGFGPIALGTPTDGAEIAKGLLEDLVAKGLSRCPSGPPVTVHPELRAGDPGRALVSASEDAGLLVVGGRGHGFVRSAVLGSATSYVLHHAQCPVMVVPETGPPRARIARVIVGVDGSPSSRTALRWGLDAARRADCPLIALHCWLLTTLPSRPPMQYVPPLSAYESEARSWLEQEVTAALPDTQQIDVHTELSHSGAASGLLDMTLADDLLVVGSRGHGGFANLVLGSVATQCSRHARGVVVVVRADQERLDQ